MCELSVVVGVDICDFRCYTYSVQAEYLLIVKNGERIGHLPGLYIQSI